MGWKETREPSDGSLIWYINSCKSIDHKLLNYKMCYFNRYPRSGIICRKKPFQLLIKKYQRFFMPEFDFIPQTFILPEDYKEYSKFFDENKDKIMLAKPSKGRGGEGIFFVKSKRDISKETIKAYDYVLQEYISNPFLIDNKKFDFRLYLLIKGVNEMEAYIAMEGMARFCTEDYDDPKKCNHGEDFMDDRNLFSHLTNYCLNKENDHYVLNSDFKTKENDDGSKRLFSKVLSKLEKLGVDPEEIKSQVNDICTKVVIALQPFLIHSYHVEMGISEDTNQNCFHVFGIDILLDNNHKCWMLEINSFPSFNFYFEKESQEDEDIVYRKHKTVSDFDKYLKTLILKEAISIVKCESSKCKTDVFHKIFPPQENPLKYKQLMVYNDARVVYELLTGFRKPDSINLSQFQKLCSFPGMKTENFGKPEYGILFQNLAKKSNKSIMTVDAFNSALERIGAELFTNIESEYSRFSLTIKRILDYVEE